MTKDAEAAGEEPIDYPTIRQRFPWVGRGATEEHDFSKTYRDVMAGALSKIKPMSWLIPE
ncbi:hypothetical protein [Microbispora sp. NBC_01389]|uniref:hypothetical protein n=1 Tax=Microbispora sp. NBC_01389 TaxID=2903584 RepID=UPI00324A9A96